MKATKSDCGGYEYRGRHIYRATERRGAYNPWKIALTGKSFPTLAEAKKYIDSREAGRTPEAP